jgi:3-oxoacyl-[acyl-carrier-protein] synthase II
MASPIGNSLSESMESLRAGRHGFSYKGEWDSVKHLRTRLAADVKGIDFAAYMPRRERRTMGRVAMLAAYAADQAIADASLERGDLASPRVGLAFGSTEGSSSTETGWYRAIFESGGMRGVAPSDYLKFMSHTCAANLGVRYGIRGRVISTCAACVSGSQAVGTGFEAIRAGIADVMICGGAEEMHFTHAGIFDIMHAASTAHNDAPDRASRPFDEERDGLVVGEGGGALILEEREAARARGARVHAEVLGYAITCDGTHITSPTPQGMSSAMMSALDNADLSPGNIEYINAHATGTEKGDIAESQAMESIFGNRVPVSSTKSFTGHTLGACGAIESGFTIQMMREGWFAPNRTLESLDPRCSDLDYVIDGGRELRASIVMNNNFAFGGINTSLIFAAHE